MPSKHPTPPAGRPATAVTGPTTILALPGSLRRGSYNRLLLEAAARFAPPGVTLRTCAALGAIPLFDEDLERPGEADPAGVEALRSEVRVADGVLIATPEYNQSLPGVLKNGLDWLSRPRPDEVLSGKPVAIVGATTGAWGTRLAQSALRHVLTAMEAQVLPAPSLFVAGASALFDDGGRLTDATTQQRLQSLLLAFTQWIDGLEAGRRAGRFG